MLELVDDFETEATDVAASIMAQLNNTKSAVSFKKIVQDIDHYSFAEAQEKLIQFIKSNQR